jgi:transposase
MAANPGIHVLTDGQWAGLEPLINEGRPHGKVPHGTLRQTIAAILWRHQNGAKGRSVPSELGPWWKAAQTFIRWARLGVRDRLLDRVQQGGVARGMAFLDGTSIRAHHQAAGAGKRGPTAKSATAAKRLAARVVALAPRPAASPTAAAGPSPSRWLRARPTNCPWRRGGSAAYPTFQAGCSAIAASPPMPSVP